MRETLVMTIPQMGLMLCHLGISMTDLWVAGQLHSDVLASLGTVSQIHMLLMIVVSMAGSGCLAVITQALGAGRTLRATRYVGLIVGLSLAAGLVVGALGILCLPVFVYCLRVPPHLVPTLETFLLAYCCQIGFYYCLIMSNTVFRAHKQVWTPFIAIATVCVSNFIGSVGFGLGRWGMPFCGAAGVAWATFASALIGLACNLATLYGRGMLSRRSFAPLRWCRVGFLRLFAIGGPATLAHMLDHAASLVVMALLTGLGNTSIVSGMTLGMRLSGVVSFPVHAFGMTMAIVSGHLLGARQGAAAYAFGLRCGRGMALVMAVAGLGLWLARAPLLALFSPDAPVVGEAEVFLAFSCVMLPLHATS
ncbi:MAG: hypothetical protein IKH84_05930, partial [Ottowia sp.]|nr:hypothetical protein [Ottowia sp.]